MREGGGKEGKEEIISKEFPFTQEGKDAAVDWLNEIYDEKYRN